MYGYGFLPVGGRLLEDTYMDEIGIPANKVLYEFVVGAMKSWDCSDTNDLLTSEHFHIELLEACASCKGSTVEQLLYKYNLIEETDKIICFSTEY